MNHAEAVHVLQAARDINQLNGTSVRLFGGEDQRATYKLSAVHLIVPFNKLHDVPVFHPLGDHRKPEFTHRHPKQR